MKKNIVVKSNKLVTAIQNLSLFEARIIQLAIVDARESGKGLHVDQPLRIDAFRYAEVFKTTRHNAYIKLEETEEQRTLLSAEVTTLKNENSVLANRIETELRTLKAELEKVGAEKDRFVAEAIATASRVTRMRTRWEQDRLALEHTREALMQAASRLQEIENHPIDGD